MSFRKSSQFSKECVDNLLCSSSESQSEQDRRKPPCTVDLYIRPVEGSTVAKHWVLHFLWQHFDESYEANANEDGDLVPIAYEGKPKEVKNLKYEVTRIKDDFRIYPDTVKEIAKKNKFNMKKYDLLTCNCQNWVRELGKQLNLKMPDSQVTQGVDIGATLVAAAGAVLGGAAVVVQATNKKK